MSELLNFSEHTLVEGPRQWQDIAALPPAGSFSLQGHRKSSGALQELSYKYYRGKCFGGSREIPPWDCPFSWTSRGLYSPPSGLPSDSSQHLAFQGLEPGCPAHWGAGDGVRRPGPSSSLPLGVSHARTEWILSPRGQDQRVWGIFRLCSVCRVGLGGKGRFIAA